MTYKCIDCGFVFEEGEEAVWEEDRGEFWGAPCSERVSGCPKCHGDYEEASECTECGEWHFTDELDDGVCPKCQEKGEGDYGVLR